MIQRVGPPYRRQNCFLFSFLASPPLTPFIACDPLCPSTNSKTHSVKQPLDDPLYPQTVIFVEFPHRTSATYNNTFFVSRLPTQKFYSYREIFFGNITHRTFCFHIKKDWIAQKRLDLHESTHKRGILSKFTRRRTKKA